jgi:hypothetical protein
VRRSRHIVADIGAIGGGQVRELGRGGVAHGGIDRAQRERRQAFAGARTRIADERLEARVPLLLQCVNGHGV